MLTKKQAREIQAENYNMSMKFIHWFDEEWELAVKRVNGSKKNLGSIPIVEKGYSLKNVRT